MSDFLNFLFVELGEGALTEGKPFEAFTNGTFRDMRGKLLKVEEAELPQIVKNTKALIDATADKEGVVLGLPIDAKGHDKGDAAGWIVGVELVDNIIKLIPKWTEVGIEKISKNIQRLFSISFKPDEKSIVGGSLTNWPAVDGLKPIELQESGLFTMELTELDRGESLSERIRRVRQAFRRQFSSGATPELPYAFVDNVYMDFAVIEAEGTSYRAGYDIGDEGEVTFNARNDWKRIRMVPKEFSEEGLVSGIVSGIKEGLSKMFKKTELESPLSIGNEGDDDMKPEELEKLKADIRSEVIAELAKPLGLEGDDDAVAALVRRLELPEVSGAVDLEGVRTALVGQLRELLKSEYDKLQAGAGKMLTEMMAEMKKDSDIVDFAETVTAGKDGGLGLPVESGKVESFLKTLDDNQRALAVDIFGSIVKTGLVDFGEAGSDGKGARLLVLPEELQKSLDEGTIKIEDLSEPVMVPLLEGHKPEEYDLSKWAGKDKEED